MSKELVFPHWCPKCYRDVYDRTTYKVQRREIVCPCGFVVEPLPEELAHRVNKAIRAQVRPAIQAAYHGAHGGIIYTDVLAQQLRLDHGLVKSVVNDLICEGKLKSA